MELGLPAGVESRFLNCARDGRIGKPFCYTHGNGLHDICNGNAKGCAQGNPAEFGPDASE